MWLLFIVAICVSAYLASRDPYWAKVLSRGLLCLSAIWVILIVVLIGSWASTGTLFSAAVLPPVAIIAGMKTLSWVFGA